MSRAPSGQDDVHQRTMDYLAAPDGAPSADIVAYLKRFSPRDLKVLIWRKKWLATARPKQLPPDHPASHIAQTEGVDPGWTEWGLLAGRGFGKSLTGAQWLAYEALTDPEALPSYVIAPTLNDVRYTCFEGATGLLSLIPKEIVKDYNRTNLIITLDNGAVIRGFSAEEPERLRGPQGARCWADELAAWGEAEGTWDMMMFGLRLGSNPKVVWTTTPKPKELVKKLILPKRGRHITSGSTYENKDNLADSFFEQLKQYEGTQLGRQELLAEIIDAEEGGIIQRSWFRMWPHDKPLPKFEYVAMSLDTAFTEKTVDRKTHNADPTACGVFGVFWHEDRTQVLVLDSWEDHLGLPDLVKRVKKELQASYGEDDDKPMFTPLIGSPRATVGPGSGRKPDILLIEDKGSGISLRQMLMQDGIDAYSYNPGRADKLSRLHMASDIFAQRRVWLPESEKVPGKPKRWTDKAVTQICSYKGPGSIKHDDHVDVFSQMLIFLKHRGLLEPVKKTAPEREREREIDERPRQPRTNPYAA